MCCALEPEQQNKGDGGERHIKTSQSSQIPNLCRSREGSGKLFRSHWPLTQNDRGIYLPGKTDSYSKHDHALFSQLLSWESHGPLGLAIRDDDKDLGHRAISASGEPSVQAFQG